MKVVLLCIGLTAVASVIVVCLGAWLLGVEPADDDAPTRGRGFTAGP